MERLHRYHYLKAMGIPVWVSQDSDAIAPNNPEFEHTPVDKQTKVSQLQKPSTPKKPRLDSEPDTKTYSPVDELLNSLSRPHRDNSQPPSPTSPSPEASFSNKTFLNVSQLSLAELREKVSTCQQCSLSEYRSQTVFGTGSEQASLMVIGEAPGADEDRQGKPFVGRAGQLLTNMLQAIDIDRKDVFIANILKCRPPNNRDPQPQEANACIGYLHRQISLVQPKLIMVVGRIAAQNLLETKQPLGRLRNQIHQLPNFDIPVIATYHPAYLLRQPRDKRKAWEDLKTVLKQLQS